MANSKLFNSCLEKIGELELNDDYLGRRDQTPEIDNKLQELEGALQRLEKDIQSKSLRLMEEIKSDFSKQVQLINEAKTSLDSIFSTAESTPYKAITFKRTSHALHQQVNWMSRKLRPRLLRSLEKLSPKYKTLEKPLWELNNLRLLTVKPLEDYLWQLQNRKQRNEIYLNTTIYELEFQPRIEQLCRYPIMRVIRCKWLLFKCHRKYDFFQLPFKPIILECLISGSEINPARLIQRHIDTHTELNNRLADAWRSIHYNLETAATEFDDLSDSLRNDRPEDIGERPHELNGLVNESLQTCLETIDDAEVTYASFLDAISAEISQDHENALKAIRKGISDSKKFKTRVRWKWRLFRKSWRKRIESFLDLLVKKLATLKNLTSKVIEGSAWWYTLLQTFHVKLPVEENLLRLTDLPTEEELLESSKSLPPIYRRLYRNEPLTNREFLVGMEEELSLIAETLERWQSDRASSVAVVGPEGSGKTSLFNCFENDLPDDINVVRSELQHRLVSSDDVISMFDDLLEFEEPSESVGELLSKILQKGRHIIMLENCHQLFLRVVGGREALDTFFYILMNTRTQVFWLLSFRLVPWIRLSYLINIERYFTHIIKSEFHSVQEMISALLLRQRATGQEPIFSTEGINSHKVRKLLTKHKENDAPIQNALADIYFDNLYTMSGGNMESALYYWLRSLEINEHGRIVVQPCVKVDSTFIKRLDTINLLSLAEVLAHGSLSAKEHCQIFNIEEFRSRMVLDYLRQIRLLQGINYDKHGQPMNYSVNALFYEQVRSILEALHMIY